MGLDVIIKFGYALIIVTITFMIWASLSYGKEIEINNYPPCIFNPLCSCSKTMPDLGIVKCRNVPFPNIPNAINISKVYTLTMDKNALMHLEPYFLQNTGIYQLEITNNKLNTIPDDVFYGLERSLWELYLQNNCLTEVPSRALRNLNNLKILNLHGNKISYIDKNAWIGISYTIKVLDLSENSISTISKDTFGGLPLLESLDLSGNNINEIDPNIFKIGLGRISKLSLSDNLLVAIPYIALSPLRFLKKLDLSYNRIRDIGPLNSNNNVKLSLDSLHLEYNFIKNLETNSFANFDIVNRTFLDGNIIDRIEDSAFKNAKIRELYMRACGLHHVSPSAFDGLENSLQVLDLSNNNITSIPEKLLMNFTNINLLNLNDNNIQQKFSFEMFAVFHESVNELHIKTKGLGLTSLQSIKSFRNLHSLLLIDLSTKEISSEDFMGYESNLERLKITRSSLNKIGSHAFFHVRGIKELDFSENEITIIDQDAFIDIGHTLNSLIISHGFSSQITTLPTEPLKPLMSLELLDISNNKIKSIPENSFYFLRNLMTLKMHDNQIEKIVKGTFQNELHSKLEEVSLSFNNLATVDSNTFADLQSIIYLHLDDNQIHKIEKQAFLDLDFLKVLNLRGNKISTIEDEAFQNLPRLQLLDVSYNVLKNFDFHFIDQVGSLSSLHVNFSHNNINELSNKNTSSTQGITYDYNLFSNIRIFDLSHNNISVIQNGYFKPIEMSTTHLYLNNNKLRYTAREIFGNLYHLQWLDLSHNLITDINAITFQNTRKLQVVQLSHNRLSNISADLFRTTHNLRIVDLSHNNIKVLPESLFLEDGMSIFDISHNQLTKVPTISFTNLAALSLAVLDLSSNNIGSIYSMDFSKFRSLASLDLSYNQLIRLEDAVFATLYHLTYLDLSHNNNINVIGKTFVGLENNLVELRINNLSLNNFPDLPLAHLRTLKIAHNELTTIPDQLAENISSLRHFDLSYNNLTHIPLMLHSLPLLKSLSIAGNPIKIITNANFKGAADTLEFLDISKLQLSTFEPETLDSMTNLRTLKISSYSNIMRFNIPQIIQKVHNLRTLWISHPITLADSDSIVNPQVGVDIKTDLRREMEGKLPEKLCEIVVTGPGFQKLAETILNGVQSPKLHFQLKNTSIAELPTTMFKNTGNLRNISLDLRHNNPSLRKIPNPNTFSGVPQKLLLTDLKISGTNLQCDCEIGWIEFWLRTKRQYLCSSTKIQYKNLNLQNLEVCKLNNDLREATCENKNNEKLIEVLKTDIECGGDSKASKTLQTKTVLVIVLFLAFWI